MNPNSLKSARIVNDDPWAVLVALASLIILATLVSIVVLCLLWRRYRNSRFLFENNLTGMTNLNYEMPVHTESTVNLSDQRHKEYEVQSLDMYVPPDDRDEQLDEAKNTHHLKEITLMQSQLPDNKILDFGSTNNLEDKLNLNESSLYRRVMNYTKFYNQN